nr:p21 [Pineapple mealybug wilt-associated virus 6]
MEFRPVELHISFSDDDTTKLKGVRARDLSYAELFDTVKDFRVVDSDTGATVEEVHLTNTAFMLSPYKIFNASFSEDGTMTGTGIDSEFRVYNTYTFMREVCDSILTINFMGLKIIYDGFGGSSTEIFYIVTKKGNTKVVIFLPASFPGFDRIVEDLRWEQEMKKKLKGRDLLDALLLMENYPAFK